MRRRLTSPTCTSAALPWFHAWPLIVFGPNLAPLSTATGPPPALPRVVNVPIYRVYHGRRRGSDQRKGFTEADYARLLDDAHQQLGGPLVVVWDNLNTHLSRAMAELVAALDWLTVYQLPPYRPSCSRLGLIARLVTISDS